MIEKVGVIGAGAMGNGIAHVCALAHMDVTLVDINEVQLGKALETIHNNMDRQIRKQLITEQDRDAALARIQVSLTYDALKNSDIVIEAATEKEEIKKEIMKKVSPLLKPSAMIASNTSSISITRLGAATDRPAKFIGIHFMNPVPVMQLVELIRGLATDDETFNAAKGLAERLGKTTATAEDFPAFIVNRILLPMINEAIYTLYEGVGSVDSIGLDVCLSVMQVLYDGLADSKYRPCPLLVKYVEAGWLGKKTKRGFYDYSTEVPTPTR
jgi:3-hydroxybutyryl-CoA dehydrogenase